MAAGDCLIPYAPLATLKPFAENVWIIDGPVVNFRYLHVIAVPFTTRATVVRIGGDLWVHSPVAIDDGLAGSLEALGQVRWLVEPNRLHTTWAATWKARFPNATLFAAPGADMAGANPLEGRTPEEWTDDIHQWIAPGDLMDEAIFLHRPSGTLILTDLIQNVEPNRVRCTGWRWLMQIFGAAAPHGSAPYDLRATFLRHRSTLRTVLAEVLATRPRRVILSHGLCITENAEADLRRAFRWVGV